jgi:hypothetical protein
MWAKSTGSGGGIEVHAGPEPAGAVRHRNIERPAPAIQEEKREARLEKDGGG